MSKASRQLDEDLVARTKAWKRFDARFARTKEDMQPGSLFCRAAGHAGRYAKDVGEEALEIASAHKGILAAATGALALWLMRNPILAALGFVPGEEDITEETQDDDD